MADSVKSPYITMSLSDTVVKYIEDKILFGEYKSGDRINEYTIASELEISRAPIREALRELQMMGFLDFSPRRGCKIAELTKADVDEVFDIRILLEKDILEILLAKDLLSSENIAILEQKCIHMEEESHREMANSAKVYLLNELDLDFHSSIWRMTQSPRRSTMLKNLFMQLLIFMNNNTKTLGSMEEKAKEHWDLLNALKSQNIISAKQELDRHINSYRYSIFDVIV